MIGLRILNRVNDFSHDISFGERYMQNLLDQPMTSDFNFSFETKRSNILSTYLLKNEKK